ncbi:MAG TPA: exostosin family protein [Candidatus Paceibacterota bacterium]
MRPKVYIGELLPDKKSYLPILYPNLGRIHKPNKLFLDKAYDVLTEPVVEIVNDPKTCDYFLLPYDYFNIEARQFEEYLKNFTALAHKHNKKIIIFDFSDLDKKIYIPDSIQFRVSLYKTDKSGNEIAMPPFVENLGVLTPRAKSDKPTIGFVGYSRATLKSLFKFGAHKPGLYFRHKAIGLLQDSNDVITNFKERTSYAGHIDTINMNPVEARQEFIDNIASSDLTLAPKGDGNYSIRFFETLALGRIPILIDTDCVLPFEDVLDYSKFIFRINYRELDKISDKFQMWWETLSSEEFQGMQTRAREAFENHLRMDKFLPQAFDKYL